MKKFILLSTLLALFSSEAYSADIPTPSRYDARVRYQPYIKDEVTIINVKRGAVTRVVLAEDEKIVEAATGFTADCKKDESEWCIHADKGNNQIWIKPKDNATNNNLELRTDKHDYSIQFNVLNEVKKGKKELSKDLMYRVIFTYQPKTPSAADFQAFNEANFRARENELLKDRLDSAVPEVRNTKFTMEVMKDSQDIAPSMVYDDGRFTCFTFPANREVPTIFYVAPSGEESRINFSVVKNDLDCVHRTGRKFVLRLDKSTVGIWNEAFDPDGVAAKNGTTVDGVDRVLLKDK